MDDSLNPEGSMFSDADMQSAPDPTGGGLQQVLQSGLSTPGIAPSAVPNSPQSPTAAPKRHGGLLTGLVGVLLDGLSAGVKAPMSDQGPSIAAQQAAQAPMQRQQQNIALQSQQLQLKTQLAQSHVQDLQTRLLSSGLEEELASGLSDAGWKFFQKNLEQGTAKMVSGEATSREAAAAKLKELHDQGKDNGVNLFMAPGMTKGTWGVWEIFPKSQLQDDINFTIPGNKDQGGSIEDVQVKIPAGTDAGTAKVIASQAFRDQAVKLHTASQEKIAENKPDQTQVVQNMVGGKPHNVLVNKRTGAQIKDMGEAQPRAAGAGTPEDIAQQAKMLVEGDLDPSQVSKSRAAQGPILAAADKYSQAVKGKPYDATQQQSDYKYANNVGTQNTLKYLNSLTGNDNKSGNLGTLISLSDTITRTDFPALNDAAAWSRLQAGDPAIAQYKTAVTEVADQVAKILQGGGSGAGTSDAKLQQAQEMFREGFSKSQIKGVASTLRELLANRKREMIGDNVYLLKQYGRQAKTADRDAAAQKPPTGATMKVPGSDGKLHWSDGKKDLGLAE